MSVMMDWALKMPLRRTEINAVIRDGANIPACHSVYLFPIVRLLEKTWCWKLQFGIAGAVER